MKLTRRFLALLLAFSMSLSMVTPAFATEVETVEETAPAVVVEEVAEVEAEAANDAAEDPSEASKEATTEASEETTTVSEESEPAGSSDENPILLYPYMFTNGAYTASVPAGATVYYALYNAGGMLMTIGENEPVTLTGSMMFPDSFHITNDTEADADYVITLAYPDGHQQNPEVIESVNYGYAVIEEGDFDGYFYSYIAEGTGYISLGISWITEGVEGDIVLSNNNTYQNRSLSAEGANGIVVMAVTEGDEIIINVVNVPDANYNYPASEISWTGAFSEYEPGTENNPINITSLLAWNEDNTAATAAVTVAAGATMYFNVDRVGGMELTIDGTEIIPMMGNFWSPSSFTITNDGEEAAEYSLSIAHPLGSSANPEALYGQGTSTTSVEAGDYDGYYYTYTADGDGTLEFSIDSVTEGVVADISVNIEGSYSYPTLLADGIDGILYLDVTEGDVVTIQVVANEDAEGNYYPAADIEWTFNYPYGSELNPIFIEFNMNDEWTEGDATITVPANTSYVCAAYSAGMVLTINGGNEQLLVAEGMGRVPVQFTVTNDTDAEATYALHIEYPAGHQMNPEELYWLGTSYATLAEGDYDGYYYIYTAEADGTLEFSVVSAGEGIAADIAVTNQRSYEQKSVMNDAVKGVASIDVLAGDVLVIDVVSVRDAEGNYYPAANVEWAINYTLGHELNPIYPEFELDENNEINYTITVPANTTYHFCSYSINGMLMSINGGEAVLMKAEGMGRVPVTFTITNDTDAPAEYALHLEYPVGNSMNPAEFSVFIEGESNYMEGEDWGVNEGENIAVVAEGSFEGYTYIWTAPVDGQLTVTLSDGKAGWTYVINNLTAGKYGDFHYSCDVPAANSETIFVSAGDEIQLIINSCGATQYDITPAGSVYFRVSYAKIVGTEANPYIPTWNDWTWNEDWTVATWEVTVPAGTTYYVGMTNTDKMLTINDGEAVQITGSSWAPESFKLEAGEQDTVFTLKMFDPVGTMANPEVIETDSVSKTFEESAEAYYYKYIASERGIVTFTFSGETWQYQINHDNAFLYPSGNHADDPSTAVQSLEVNKGDELVIQIGTYNTDPETWWITPAGEVTVDVAFEAGEGTECKAHQVFVQSADNYFDGEAPANDSVYHEVYGVVGMEMHFSSVAGSGLTVTFNGETYNTDENGNLTMIVPGNPMMSRMPVSIVVNNATDSACWYDFSFSYPYGSTNNPAELVIGKNSVALEANDSDGFNYAWIATADGYLTVTMTSKSNWIFSINKESLSGEFTWGDIHYSTDGVVSETIYVNEGDRVTLNVGTEDWGEGTIKFTAAFTSKQFTLRAGKSVTLKFTDPDTGKNVSATKANWKIVEGAEYATINTSGKVTAKKTVAEPVTVIVMATLKADETISNTFAVKIYPSATKVTIWDGNFDASGKVATLDTNKITDLDLDAKVESEHAMQNVTWKSSNTKIATVNSEGVVSVVWNEKTQAYKTGSVTITATAADGSGKKATVKINFVTTVREMEITSKNGQLTVGSGKSLSLVANVNADATNKSVTWEIVSGSEYATINKTSGKLTAVKGLTTVGTVVVKATPVNAYVDDEGEKYTATETITVTPLATKVVISGVPATHDLNSWNEICPTAAVFAADDNFLAFQGVKWTTSNKQIAEVVEGYSYEVWDFVDMVQFNGKTGTVKLTATATDGSGVKGTVTIKVIQSPTYIEMPMEAFVVAGKTLTLKPAVYPETATDKTLDWTISENAIEAKVVNGKISANKKLVNALTEPLTLTVTATAKMADPDGVQTSASCEVTFYPATTKVNILNHGMVVTGKTKTIDVNETVVLYAESEPGVTAEVYTWKSSNTKIATVETNADGSVTVKPTGTKTGKVTITATAADGTKKAGKITLNVVRAVQSLTLEETYEVTAGKSLKLGSEIEINPTNASNKKLTWKVSSNEIGAKISTTGTLTTSASKVKAPVELTVTVIAKDGFGAVTTAKIIVNPAN